MRGSLPSALPASVQPSPALCAESWEPGAGLNMAPAPHWPAGDCLCPPGLSPEQQLLSDVPGSVRACVQS